jgi:hypothetical protein
MSHTRGVGCICRRSIGTLATVDDSKKYSLAKKRRVVSSHPKSTSFFFRGERCEGAPSTRTIRIPIGVCGPGVYSIHTARMVNVKRYDDDDDDDVELNNDEKKIEDIVLMNSKTLEMEVAPAVVQRKDEDEQERNRVYRRRRLLSLIAAAAILVVICMAVVGGVCGAGKCGNSSTTSKSASTEGDNNSVPTVAPLVATTTTTPRPSVTTSIENDTCESAMGPYRIGGHTVQGVVSADTAVLENDVPFCNNRNNNNAVTRGLWYKVTGGGEVIRASTCPQSNNNSSSSTSLTTTAADTIVDVFSGNSCNDLRCVAFNDQFCGDQSSVSWLAEKGVTYYVLVEVGMDTSSSTTSTFELRIDYEDNGTCQSAIGPVDGTRGAVVTGSMRGAGLADYYTCDMQLAWGGQVFYWVRLLFTRCCGVGVDVWLYTTLTTRPLLFLSYLRSTELVIG